MKKIYAIHCTYAKKYALTALFFFITFHVFAHTGTVTGFVYDQDTKVPLKGATVSIEKVGTATITNALGEFKITESQAGCLCTHHYLRGV